MPIPLSATTSSIVPPCYPRSDPDPSSGIGELDRIRDDVEQHLFAGAFVGNEFGQPGRPHDQGELLCLRRMAHDFGA